MTFFTKDEALNFCSNNLKITATEEKLSLNPTELLDEIATAMQTLLLFQNIRLLSTFPPSQRHRPTLLEIKCDLLNGLGGLCYNLNVSVFFLLQSLGYKVSLAHATCTTSVMFPNNHVVVYVHDVIRSEDRFLVEVGCGFPTFRAVDLGFETESPVFVDSFLEYKYVKHDGKILRFHRKGCTVIRSGIKYPETDFYLGEWRRFYTADTQSTTDLSQFDSCFDCVWKNGSASPFHTTFRIISFPEKQAVMIVNHKTLIEDKEGELVAAEIVGGDDGVKKAVNQLFPVIPPTLVEQAWNAHKPA